MNHAQEAEKHIKWAHEWQEDEGATDATAIATPLLAQVHATLALAEQQRIANLIALAELADRRFSNYAGLAGPLGTIFNHPPEPSGNMLIKPEIAAALKIGDQA